MAKYKKNRYSFWHSPIILFVLFCFFILFGYNIAGLVKKERETSYKKELILEQIDELKNKEDSLSKDLAKLKTDEGQEEIIREKYQVVKSGEKMVVIVDGDNQNKLPSKEENGHSFFSWFKKLFNK